MKAPPRPRQKSGCRADHCRVSRSLQGSSSTWTATSSKRRWPKTRPTGVEGVNSVLELFLESTRTKQELLKHRLDLQLPLPHPPLELLGPVSIPGDIIELLRAPDNGADILGCVL